MTLIRIFLATVLLTVFGGRLPAATVLWTNAAGGNWSAVTNWSPNQVPTIADTVFITNNGTYAVTLNVSATCGSLTLGGTSGAQALSNNSVILTLTNTGQRSCFLDGYPGLGLQDRNHRAVASHTFWGPTWFDPDPGRQLIVLSPGETASADLAWTSGALPGHAVFAAYLG